KIKEPEYQSLNVIPNTQTYQLGDEDKHIKTIKIGLSALNYETNNKSKIFDNDLEDAVKSFQKDNNLTVTEKYDKQTNNKYTQALVNKANKEDTVLKTLLNKLN